MHDAHDLLERARRRAPAPTFSLEDVRSWRDRRVRGKRLRATAVGLLLAISVFAVVATAFPRQGDRYAGLSGETLPPAAEAPLVAQHGEYYYRAILIAQHCVDHPEVCGGNDVQLDATYWWSPADDSGRIAVDGAKEYGIQSGRFGPGAFPNDNGIDVSNFPLDPRALTAFLLQRSADEGASPAPLVTPPPDGAPEDGRLWRAITDLLEDPHVTPAVRAALVDVAAGLQGAHVTLDSTDPFGRPAHIVEFGNWGGHIVERLYVDPDSHDLLCWTSSVPRAEFPFRYYVVQQAGVVGSTEAGLSLHEGSVPGTMLSVSDLPFGPGEGGTPKADGGTGGG
jgi:hypothetical protein